MLPIKCNFKMKGKFYRKENNQRQNRKTSLSNFPAKTNENCRDILAGAPATSTRHGG